jgi:hypothetical protein
MSAERSAWPCFRLLDTSFESQPLCLLSFRILDIFDQFCIGWKPMAVHPPLFNLDIT